MSEHGLPKFEVTPQTELLCADLPNDSNGRVFAHLLRQTDVAAQQNAHIIREQLKGQEARDELLKRIEEHTQIFKKHVENDSEEFAKIKSELKPVCEKVESWGKTLNFIFSRNGILAGVIAAFFVPLAVNLITEKVKSQFVTVPFVLFTNSIAAKP